MMPHLWRLYSLCSQRAYCVVPRIALLIEYSGKKFHGCQFQAGLRTVQSELEKALTILTRTKAKVTFSGRTDAGVHAAGQVVHFDLPHGARVGGSEAVQIRDADDLDLWQFTWALNGILPFDLSVKSAQVVPANFHARFTATSRQYVYRILNRAQRSALLKDTHYFIPFYLDQSRMQRAASCLLGTHDFSSFKSSNTDRTESHCSICRVEFLNLGEGQLEFWIAADHFVYNMVRIVVGTLVEIGLGKKASESLLQALKQPDRNLAGPTAPPWGLTLDSVKYPSVFKLFELSAAPPTCSESKEVFKEMKT